MTLLPSLFGGTCFLVIARVPHAHASSSFFNTARVRLEPSHC